MNGLPEVVAVWVENTRRLHVYNLVTEGEDAGMAYEVVRTPFDAKPAASGIDGVELETVKDLVELDKVRCRLGLTRATPATAAFGLLWRGSGKLAKLTGDSLRAVGVPVPSVAGGGIRVPTSQREYRYGHKKYAGS